MPIIIRSKADNETIKKVAKDLDGYIKFVVDTDQGILAAGGLRHVDCEQLLLNGGESKQESLWGGGVDLETGEIDFDSMINIRPHQGNPSREVLSGELRTYIEEVVRKILR